MKALAIVTLILAICVVALFSGNSRQTEQIAGLQKSLDEALAKLQNEDHAAKAQSDSLSTKLKEQAGNVAGLTATLEGQKAVLASLKEDVAKGVQSGLTQEIVKTAADKALKDAQERKGVWDDPNFVESVAMTVVEKFGAKIRGNPGADAKDDVVAALLAKDPDFLETVSATLILSAGEKKN